MTLNGRGGGNYDEKGTKIDGCVAERLRRQDQNLIFLGFPGFDPQHTHQLPYFLLLVNK